MESRRRLLSPSSNSRPCEFGIERTRHGTATGASHSAHAVVAPRSSMAPRTESTRARGNTGGDRKRRAGASQREKRRQRSGSRTLGARRARRQNARAADVTVVRRPRAGPQLFADRSGSALVSDVYSLCVCDSLVDTVLRAFVRLTAAEGLPPLVPKLCIAEASATTAGGALARFGGARVGASPTPSLLALFRWPGARARSGGCEGIFGALPSAKAGTPPRPQAACAPACTCRRFGGVHLPRCEGPMKAHFILLGVGFRIEEQHEEQHGASQREHSTPRTRYKAAT